eukprot:TRINITY_DN2961_c0_g1_i6.p1 TRINITY_DN2961_c0_g1~~TRINITY_DN2961_c0_g1_i6.p1  ORF type:complete len:651 (-),score=82.01 TRINITY_DN2961_c0_g1_i6:1184-2980(-)
MRNLLQSAGIENNADLQQLCGVQSELKGAYVMFNEVLLRSLCDRSNGVCIDMEPADISNNGGLSCSSVVEQGLCNDIFYTRNNYCAKSCNRCDGGGCSTTVADCQCLSSWTVGSGGEEYSGCANPDNDPNGPWCRVDPATCTGAPNGKDRDYCYPSCSQYIDLQTASEELSECEIFGDECSNRCEGEANLDEVVCYGVPEEERVCVCKDAPLRDTLPTAPAIASTAVPVTPSDTAASEQLTSSVIEGDCYDFLPESEGTCRDRIEWNSCGESWMSEKFYCAISCGFCDEPLSQQHDCLSDFQDCLEQCGSDADIQEFACFRIEKKSECTCAREVKRVSSAQQDIPTDNCFDFIPENEGTCEQRKEWGSCTEEWMAEKNYCALTCGFCEPTQEVAQTAVAKSPLDLSRDIAVPSQVPSPKDPTGTLAGPATAQNADLSDQVLTVINSADTGSLFSAFTSADAEAEFLEAHNAIREAHCTPQLEWSSNLELEAQLWAERCVQNLDPASTYGQNLFYYRGFEATPQEIVQQWYQASDTVNYNDLPALSQDTSTLYQLLWESTTTVGCGSHECVDGMKVVVCAYDPKGNVQSQEQDNVRGPC